MDLLCDFLSSELTESVKELGMPAFVAKQITQWVYDKNTPNWQGMLNLSNEKRELFAKQWMYPCLIEERVVPSEDGQTWKFLWKLRDGSFVESVLIASGDRRTVCVSSQVGCPAACAFCASGKQGFKRNLRTGEIVEQVIHIQRWLAEKGENVTHVVYMGMGEPMKNYAAVVQSIRILSHPDMFNLSQRRITVSTVGVVDGIRQLSHEGLKVSLVLSLHAPNQHIRKKIIPYARKYALEDIISAMDEYAAATHRDITYEYVLLEGINDHPDHAFELANLLRKKQCTVNLIPYNPIMGVRLKRPTNKAIKEFRSVLFGAGIVNTCRFTKGVDIAAACGQLALQHKKNMTASQSTSPLKVVAS